MTHCGLRARRQRIHRDASHASAPGVHAAALRSAAVDDQPTRFSPGWKCIASLHQAGARRSTSCICWRRAIAAKVEFLFPAAAASAPQPGSNAWAISGAHSATGKPILANDPHLDFAIPSPWYLVHFEAPGLNVTGATIVGIPGVITGHNDRIAWGVTNLEFDVQDLYREQIDLNTGPVSFPRAARSRPAWSAT